MSRATSPQPMSALRRIGDRVQIEAHEVRRFLASPMGRRVRTLLAGGVILIVPALFRVPGLRRYPLIRALELIGGAALIVRFAEALRDWEVAEQGPLVIDVPPVNPRPAP